MSVPNASQLQKAAIQEVVDLVAVDGLPEDKADRLETLRLLSRSDSWVPTHCPECAVSLESIDPVKHAADHWPDVVPASRMSIDATEREAALYRAGGARIPVRRN